MKRRINFTAEHSEKMKNLALSMLLENGVIVNKFGTPLNIVQLMHEVSVNSLNEIRMSLSKRIERLEAADEWVITSEANERIDSLREKKDLVNLLIGWKRWNAENAELLTKQKELEDELKALKESQKTPDEKIKELEAQLAELNNF